MQNTITIRHFFDAAHKLKDSPELMAKACANLHGHTYAVIVILSVRGAELTGGMVVDFKKIKNIINTLDHQYINEVFEKEEFAEEPTAENIARFLFEKIMDEIKSNEATQEVIPLRVSIAEGYKGENNSCWVVYEL